MGNILFTDSAVATANDYASAGGSPRRLPAEYEKIVFQVTEQNVNDAKAKILASNKLADDGSLDNPVTLLAETVISKNGQLLTEDSEVPTLTDPWAYVDVQYASNVAGVHGSLDIQIAGA